MKFFNRNRKPPAVEKKTVRDDKTLLKLARQYIDEKNTKEAKKCCKEILKQNHNHYLALVLLGKSLEDSDTAPLTYEKAVMVKPDHPLAWQGLAKYYEAKNDLESKTKLLSIYEKLITLQIEEDYAIKILEKHGQLSCLIKNSNSITYLLQYMNGVNNEELLQTAKKQLLLLLDSEVSCKREDIPLAIISFKKFYMNDHHNGASQIVLAKLILQSTDFNSAVKEIIDLKFFSENTALKSWLCEFICKVFVKNDSFCGFDVENYIGELTGGIEDKKYSKVLIAALHFRQGEYKEAYQQCSFAISKANEIDMTEEVLMLNCTKMLKNTALFEHLSISLSIRGNLNNTNTITTVYKSLLAAYVEQKRCFEAVSILKKISIKHMDPHVLIELTHLYCDSAINGGVVLNILDSTNYIFLFKALTYIKRRKILKALTTLRLYEKHPIKYYILARLYYKIKFQDDCLHNLHKANNLIPNNPKVCYCLGIYYYEIDRNIKECKRYLEISYSLCDTDKEVIKMLSIVYDKLERVDLEYELLQTAFRATETKDFWVCTRLGRIYYARGDVYNSIIFLQQAINLNQEDVTAYEWIGDTYFKIRDYEESLIAFRKVLDLSLNTTVLIYACYKIGIIYSKMKCHEEAIFVFQNILNIDPHSVVALKGITENRLITATRSALLNRFDTAREEAQIAVSYVTKSISNQVKDNSYWHLLGDLLLFVSRLPSQYCYVTIYTKHGVTVQSGKVSLYETVIRCFSNLLHLRDSFALFKCAISYLEYFDETKQHTLWKISYNLAVLCIKEEPNAWHNWELLGKIFFHKEKYNFAHHSFMTALRLKPPTDILKSKIWCILGLLYLRLNKTRIAQHCFNVGETAIRTEWIEDSLIRQAIIEGRRIGLLTDSPRNFHLNERDFEDWDNVTKELTISEYEPTFDAPIESFLNIPNTCLLLEWYLSVVQDTAKGCCYLGRIHEKRGLLSSALTQYEKASTMTGNDEGMLKATLLDRARILLKMERFFEAVHIFGNKKVVDANAARELAIALRRTGSYAESYIAYNTTISQLSYQLNNDEQVNILIEMTNLAYKIKSASFAATVLDRAIQVNAPSLGGTFPFIKSYMLPKVAFEVVATFMAERQPHHRNDLLWWYYRGLNYLKGPKTYGKEASKCIQRAINLTKNTNYSGELGKMHALVAIAEFYSGDRFTATKYAQEALAVYPEQEELWAALILCVFSHRNWPEREAWIVRVLHAVRQNLSLSESIRQWLGRLEENLIPPE